MCRKIVVNIGSRCVRVICGRRICVSLNSLSYRGLPMNYNVLMIAKAAIKDFTRLLRSEKNIKSQPQTMTVCLNRLAQ